LSLALGPLESSSCLVSRLNIFFIYAFVPSVRISDSAVYDLTLGVFSHVRRYFLATICNAQRRLTDFFLTMAQTRQHYGLLLVLKYHFSCSGSQLIEIFQDNHCNLRTDSRTPGLQQMYNSPLTWGGPHSMWGSSHVRGLLYICCKPDVFLSFFI